MKKNQNASASTIVNAEKKEIVKMNLDKFSAQLEGMQLKEKKIRETLYIYPEDFRKEDIGSDKGKKFRNSLRNAMKRHCNNILSFTKQKNEEKLQDELKSFNAFYKKNYRLNDFSLASISNSSDPSKERDLSLMMEIIKELKK